MSSSPEFERFEITDQDLADELHGPKRGQQSKKRAMLGIWAGSSDEEESRPGFGKKKKKKPDYTEALNFVKGGVKMGDKMVSKEGKKDDEATDEEEEDVDPRNFQDVLLQGFGKQKEAKSKPKYPPRVNKIGEDKSMGSWERHTKGFGAKMLAQMGYMPGSGLGSRGQGITTPVEAKLRKGRGAVGMYGTERTQRSLRDFPKRNSDEEEEEQFQEQMSQWKRQPKGEAGGPRKYVYQTAEALVASGGKRGVKQPTPAANVKVIDMSGREKKVFKGYQAALAQQPEKPREEEEKVSVSVAFSMPELQHNLDLLVELAADDIVNNDRKLRHAEDRVVTVEYEMETMEELCGRERGDIERLQSLYDIIDSCEKKSLPGSGESLTLEEVEEVFTRLQRDFPAEYSRYRLSSLALPLLFPLLEAELRGWVCMAVPGGPLELMRKWRRLLTTSDDPEDEDPACPDPLPVSHRLLWDVWMPPVRAAFSRWSPRNPDPAVTLLETWRPLLPVWVFNNLLVQIALPPLQREVESWKPLTDTTPIHSWLLPWLPLMGELLQPLFAPIRFKLASALTKWHPSDVSAKLILQPWRQVFLPGHLDAFLTRHVVPKLQLCLSDLVVNPHHQALEPWQWVIAWADMLTPSRLAALLDRAFFPKWLQVLSGWLGANPNYDEVTKWYTGWKTQVPAEARAQPSVKEWFKRALELMSRSVGGSGQAAQPGARENVAYLASTERHYTPPLPAQGAGFMGAKVTAPATTIPQNFKDLIHKKAEEKGIIFLPITGKAHQGHQVYKFGNVNIYIERGVVFLQEGQLWLPVALDSLVNKALSGGRILCFCFVL